MVEGKRASQAGDAPGVPARRAALRLLDAVLRKGLPLEAAFPGATSDLPRADDRGLAHAISAGTLRWLHDLDALIDSATSKPLPDDAKARFALRIALTQVLVLETPPHAAIATVLPLVDGGPRRLVHGVFGTLTRRGVSLPDRPTLPDAVFLRWQKAWGEESVEAAAAGLAGQPPLDLTLADAGETEQWCEQLGGESLMPGHVRLPVGTSVAELPGYAEGRWWVQDIAASLPARTVGAGQGRRVLDLCAAPGGKTMQLAAAGWSVTAVDMSAKRVERLAENLARTGFSAETVVADARKYRSSEPFDAVLVDAPCSATGIYRRHPDVLYRVRPSAIADLARQQADIVRAAAKMVRPGGLLVYSVCSLEPEEGEAVAREFAAANPDFQPVPWPVELPDGLARVSGGSARVMPGALAAKGGADGFFVSLFRRSGESEPAAG